MMLLTVFLKHDQSKTLAEIQAHLEQTGYFDSFPPPGIEIVSWTVCMGIGQVVTLRFPPERLRELNRVFEEKAWGAFRTEFYPTYDFKPVWDQFQAGRRANKSCGPQILDRRCSDRFNASGISYGMIGA